MKRFKQTLVKWQNFEHALLLGANRGIGLAVASELAQRYPQLSLHLTHRPQAEASDLKQLQSLHEGRIHLWELDPTQPEQVQKLARDVKAYAPKLNLLWNFVGMLHAGDLQPEKSLRDVNWQHMQQIFQVNSLVTPLLAQQFIDFFRHEEPSIFAVLSAKVGSITDNRMGGWYSYRASKAALNMFLRNISLEFHRRSAPTWVVALHPGTTKTRLSEPFTRNTKLTLHTAKETACNLIDQMQGRDAVESPGFLSWDGQTLPW